MARKYMKIRRVVIPFLTLAIMLSQLSGCAVVSPEDIVDNPDDVTLVIEEPDLDAEAGDKDTVDINGTQYDISGNPSTDTPKQEQILLTTEELHALFKKEYDSFKWAKENLGEYYKTDYLKLPAREIGTQTDANVYADIEAEVAKPEYEGKILPDDGFEQYVAWREALENGSESSKGSTTSGNNSGNTSNETQKPTTKPSGGSNNNSGSSSNNGGSSSSGTGIAPGFEVEHEVKDNGKGAESKEDNYAPPSYEIIG